jgi:hypothetical protein
LRGIEAIAMSLLLAGIFLWVVIISKDKVAPAIEKLIGDPIRNIPVRTEQRQILNFIATVIPSIIVFLFGTVFLIVYFWTSLQGVSILINFKGVLGAIIKCFAVFALVFSTAYLIYLQPKQTK